MYEKLLLGLTIAATPLATASTSRPARQDPAPAAREHHIARQIGEAGKRALDLEARALAEPWTRDLLQIRDAQKRTTALEAVRSALSSDDAATSYAGLIALVSTLDASYEKRDLAPLARSLARAARGAPRVKAFYALHGTDPTADDLELLLTALDESPDEELAESGTHLLVLLAEGQLVDRAGEAALELLDVDERRLLRQRLGGIWGARVSSALEARLIALASSTPTRHDAIYYGLSTLREKSPAVIDVLFRACEDPDPNNSERALWGLLHGVPESSQADVASFLLQLFEARSSTDTRSSCLRGLASYGDGSHVAALRELADNELLSEALRTEARQAIRRIEARER